MVSRDLSSPTTIDWASGQSPTLCLVCIGEKIHRNLKWDCSLSFSFR